MKCKRAREQESKRAREQERESKAQGKPPCCVVFVFFLPPLALVNGCFMWPQPGALGSVVDYRVSCGTDDWNDDADKFSL